jgi:hypothetical protein
MKRRGKDGMVRKITNPENDEKEEMLTAVRRRRELLKGCQQITVPS